ncbi:MAG: wax ester/triacylglycerol synthase family O-acyltransferase [Nevskia sp.]|nr:wax ester/triacylglycerol synthase family O-acyltransferase [Nevskia sp.]
MKPLSPLDAMFLWIEHRRQPMHVAGLQLFTPPPGAGPHFVQDLVESFRKFTSATPPFNQRPVFRLGHWFWDDDEEFELDYHLRHSALPYPGRIRELLALVSRLHGTLMDRSRPLWEMNIIEGLADGRVAVYIKLHHAMFDGVAATRLLQHALSEDADERKPPPWAQPRHRRRKDDQPAPAAAGLLKTLSDAMRLGRDLAPGVGSGLWEIVRSSPSDPADAQPFHAPSTMFNVRISGSRRFAAQAYSLQRFKTLAHRHGATLNDVSLAICAGALRRYLLSRDALPDKPLIAMVPVSIRGESHEDGNQVSMILANLATHVRDPDQRLRLIMQSTAHAKQRIASMTRLQQMAYAAAMAAPLGPAMLTRQAGKHPIFNLVISNVPGPRHTLYMDGFRLDQSYPISIPFDYAALNITLNSYCDHLGFGYTACRRSVPALQRMLDYTEESLRELEAS